MWSFVAKLLCRENSKQQSYAEKATHRVLKWSESDGTAVERQALEGQVTLVLESTTLCSPLCSCQIPTVPYDTLMPSG